MKKFCIGEWPGYAHPAVFHPTKRIDRSGKIVADFFAEKGIEWTSDLKRADVWIRKAELSKNNTHCDEDEKKRIAHSNARPTLLLIPEPREHSPATYKFADPKHTLAVAPGTEFKMLYDRAEWCDPQLENWKKRQDRACFIGRPTLDRIAFIRNLLEKNIPLDIYSREPWPFREWKGAAEDDVETARAYKYRIVYETSQKNLCHSEKLFLGIRSGCVTFYQADPNLDLQFLRGSFLLFNFENWQQREVLSEKVLEGIHQFMFSDAWEIYSYRKYYVTILSECELALKSPSQKSETDSFNLDEAKNYTPIFKSGLSAFSERKFEEALPSFQKLENILGPLPPILNNIGTLYLELRQYEKAQREFERALLRDPEHQEVLMNLGLCFVRQNKIAESIEIFKRALNINPYSKQAAQSLVRSLANLGKIEDALKESKNILDFYPDDFSLQSDFEQIKKLSGSPAHSSS